MSNDFALAHNKKVITRSAYGVPDIVFFIVVEELVQITPLINFGISSPRNASIFLQVLGQSNYVPTLPPALWLWLGRDIFRIDWSTDLVY